MDYAAGMFAVTVIVGGICYLIGRYRRTTVWNDLRQTLMDRTRDRNHWMNEAVWWRMRAEDAEDRLAARSVGGRFGETANRG